MHFLNKLIRIKGSASNSGTWTGDTLAYLNVGANNASVVEMKGVFNTCFVTSSNSVYCYGYRRRTGSADGWIGNNWNNDYYNWDSPVEMANLKKIDFSLAALGGSSVNAMLSVFVVLLTTWVAFI